MAREHVPVRRGVEDVELRRVLRRELPGPYQSGMRRGGEVGCGQNARDDVHTEPGGRTNDKIAVPPGRRHRGKHLFLFVYTVSRMNANGLAANF